MEERKRGWHALGEPPCYLVPPALQWCRRLQPLLPRPQSQRLERWSACCPLLKSPIPSHTRRERVTRQEGEEREKEVSEEQGVKMEKRRSDIRKKREKEVTSGQGGERDRKGERQKDGDKQGSLV